MTPTIIAIAGGSGSGKTTFANRLLSHLGSENVGIIYQDSYYIDQSHRFDKDGGAVNFDHPDALEFTLLASQLQELKKGNSVEIPNYDFATHTRLPKTNKFDPKKFILVDGILILSQECLRPLFDLSIYIQCDEKIRFERRLKRDVQERGRTPKGVRAQFENQVAPMHNQFVLPSSEFASKIVTQNEFEAQLSLLIESLT